MKKLFRIGVKVIAVAAILIAVAILATWCAVRASLPTLDGDIKLGGLAAPVSLTRDADGTVGINAQNSLDAMRALGYVHAQERFFEMDLARRAAAGELSALLGPATLSMDKDKRQHRMRARMEAQFRAASAEDREWIKVYTDGINNGLSAYPIRPWQYLLLRQVPEPWLEVDSLLVLAEMYFMLQGNPIDKRFSEIQLRKMLGDRAFDWLQPLGGEWDAALDGSIISPVTLPSAEEIDVRKFPPQNIKTGALQNNDAPEQFIGSNNWAIGGARTAHGGAMFAGDMHLGLGVPGIWFRAQMTIGTGDKARRIAGVTLPGLPQVVAGSNGDIVWGFTNSYGLWFDWVALPKTGNDNPPVATHRETIEVKGSDSVALDVRETTFGPILRDDIDHHYALSWVLHRDGGAINRVALMMFAQSMDEAIGIAHLTPTPHQNILIADKAGNIAWTILGRMTARSAPRVTRGQLTPIESLPTGWLPSAQYPLVKNPPDGQLWTANSRQMSGAAGDMIGEGGFDLGARAGQIRDRLRESLRERPKMTEANLYAIQLDSESRFLKRWGVLAQSVAGTNEKTAAIAAELKRWNGRADTDQAGHRIARAFRERVQSQLWLAWLNASDRQPSRVADLQARYSAFRFDARFEYPVWQAITVKALHLLPPPHATWDEFLAAQVAWVHDELVASNGNLRNATWGKRNVTQIRHPFSRAMPFLSRILDMPGAPQSGDSHMPRVSGNSFGASQRLVVSPGREEQGILTVAGGQSGHPLSPFYGAGHQGWLEGKATPLLAGETRHTIRFSP